MSETSSVEGSARLSEDVLTIKRRLRTGRKGSPGREVINAYRVIELEPHPDVGFPAIRLEVIPSYPSDITKGTHYDLIRTPTGWECSCGDWVFRQSNTAEGCKHLKAARVTGLI
jgi:hypothetical protein